MLFLINKKQKQKILNEYYTNLFTIFIVGIIILCAVLLISLMPTYLIMKLDRNIVIDKVRPIENSISKNKDDSSKIATSSIDNVSIFSMDVKKNTVEIYNEIKDVYKKIPNVEIVNINVNSVDKKIIIVANVENRNTASSLVDILNTTRFKGADLPYSVFNQNKKFIFSQILTYE